MCRTRCGMVAAIVIVTVAVFTLGIVLGFVFGGISMHPTHGTERAKPPINGDYIKGGLPGQPSLVEFNQYAGFVPVGISKRRNYFYYFVETTRPNPASVPVILWLNGAACSSLGTGAMIENGPFGVQGDGKSLYQRFYSWNKVANMLYVERPAFVESSYSSRDEKYYYNTHAMLIEECYSFVVDWFRKFPQYRDADFYIAGEGYAGLYIPGIAEKIFNQPRQTSVIQLKGIMVGNGMINYLTDKKGIYDYLWSHSLISDDTRVGLMNCLHTKTKACQELEKKAEKEMGDVNIYNLNSKSCNTSTIGVKSKYIDMDFCQKESVSSYLNLQEVLETLHANSTELHYIWRMCSFYLDAPLDTPSTMLPTYQKLISAGLSILLYSGDMDAIIPSTSTEFSVKMLNLTVKNTWRPWLDINKELAGYRVDYSGLSFATVRGAGHHVPKDEPKKAFSLIKWFLEKR